MGVSNDRIPPGPHLRPIQCLEGDELIIQNAKHAKKLVQCGRAGCAARALMSCGMAESCERTLGKLLTKL
jgi:hypothetical protein